MKRVLLVINILLLMFVIIGCNKTSSNQLLTNEYLKEHAKIGMTEEELREAFGKEVFNDFGDGSDVMIFDETNGDFTYKPDLQHVAFNDIKNGNLEYQLYVNLKDNKAFMFSYFFRGENNEVWLLTLTPDREWKETQTSNPQ
jgi:hypothetical protein